MRAPRRRGDGGCVRASRLSRALRGLRSRRGAVAVELALLSPVIMLMIVGAIDYGGALFERMRLESAARAGAQYALQNPGALDNTAAIEQAVRDASSLVDPLSVSVVPSVFCECPDGTAVACGGTCGGGALLRTFVAVTVTENFSPMFSYPGIASPITLTGRATIRVQ